MDAIAEWTTTYERVRDLVAGISPEQAATAVPACPAWTVHDLLSHMIGLDADVLAGDEPDDHNETWTQRQVAARADHDVAALLAEWATLVVPLQAWMRANGTRPLGDVVIHEQDLRGALGRSGPKDTAGLAALRDRLAGGFADAAAKIDGGPIALVAADQAWTCVSGGGEPDDAAVLLRAPQFDLVRALMTRRSEAQLRGWTQRGDITPFLPAFAGLGPLPQEPLTE